MYSGLHKSLAWWRSGNAAVCKTAMRGFNSRPRLKKIIKLPEWCNGSHERLKISWPLTAVWVRVPPRAHIKITTIGGYFNMCPRVRKVFCVRVGLEKRRYILFTRIKYRAGVEKFFKRRREKYSWPSPISDIVYVCTQMRLPKPCGKG